MSTYASILARSSFIFFKDFIYLFLQRREGSEKERERNINVWLPLTCSLLGTWPATEDELVTLWFAGWYSIH